MKTKYSEIVAVFDPFLHVVNAIRSCLALTDDAEHLHTVRKSVTFLGTRTRRSTLRTNG